MLVVFMHVLYRQMSFSAPRLFDPGRDESVFCTADVSSRHSYSLYSTSSDRLNHWQHGMNGDVYSCTADTVDAADAWQYRSLTDGDIMRFGGDSRL